jgi:exosortase/archaeosortase family protein
MSNEEIIIHSKFGLPIRTRIYQTVGIFVAGIGILWALTRLPLVIDYLVRPLSISLAFIVSGILQLLGEPVSQIGIFVSSSAVQLEITPACTGLYQIVVMITGLLAWTGTSGEKRRGIVIGFSLLMGINIIRIISIYYCALLIPEWVTFIHGVVWEGVMVLLVPVYWMWWVRRISVDM